MVADGRVPRLWLHQSAGPWKVPDLLSVLQAHGSRPDHGRDPAISEPRYRPCQAAYGERGRRLRCVSGSPGLYHGGLLVHRRVQIAVAASSDAGSHRETRRDTDRACLDTRPDEGTLTSLGQALKPAARSPPGPQYPIFSIIRPPMSAPTIIHRQEADHVGIDRKPASDRGSAARRSRSSLGRWPPPPIDEDVPIGEDRHPHAGSRGSTLGACDGSAANPTTPRAWARWRRGAAGNRPIRESTSGPSAPM